MKSRKLQYGNVVISGHGQLMQDGTWMAKCVVTVHAVGHADEITLSGEENYHAEQEAVTAALNIGKQWFAENYLQR